MKIFSWNVNGLRSTEKEFIKFIKTKKPDILMIQELRAYPDQLSFFLKSIPNYKVLFNPADRPGYSGTAIYYKNSIKFEKVSSVTSDEILNLEGRTIYCRIGDLYIFNFYTPNGTSSEERLKFKLDFYSHILNLIRGLINKNKSVIIGGDLNVAATELDLYAPKKNLNHSGFLESERKWFTDMLKLGFIDTFRMFEKEGGHYTWWHMRDPERKKNHGWRFDYFLVSKKLKNKVKSSRILKNVFGSDHCPIMLDIDI